MPYLVLARGFQISQCDFLPAHWDRVAGSDIVDVAFVIVVVIVVIVIGFIFRSKHDSFLCQRLPASHVHLTESQTTSDKIDI